MIAEEVPFKKDILESLPKQKNRYSVKDQKMPGLRLVVYPAGTKTFVLYKRVNNQQKKIKIGRFPDLSVEQARKRAIEFKSVIALGGDPESDKKARRDELSFKELFQYYYDCHALKFTKNPKHNKQMMEFHIFPVIGNKKLSEITKDKILRLHTKIGENRGKGTANRVIPMVSAVFNFGINNNYYSGTNPCTGLKKYPSKSRDRFLNQEELKQFFNAVELEESCFGDFFKLLLFTGARKSNVLTMKWVDIDLNLRRWRISEGESKNKDVNIVILSDWVIEILVKRNNANKNKEHPSQFVFPGDGKGQHLTDPKRAFQRIRNRMGVQDIRMHDLRRTLGSYMAISGVSLPIIGKALNHKSHVSTAIYARLSQSPVEEGVHKATQIMIK